MKKTYRRPFMGFLIACVAMLLAACGATMPAADQKPAAEPPPPPLLPAQAKPVSLVEMQFELDKKAMELETAKTMALIKFADQSGSDFAKGLVAGMINGGSGQGQAGAAPSPQRPSFAQLGAQQAAHAAEIELRKAELEERTSWWNKGLQVTDRVLGFQMFSKGLDQERYRLDASNSQQRYMWDTMRTTQQDAYSFGGRILDHGPYVLPAGVTAAP